MAPRTVPEAHWEMPVGLALSVALHLLVALLAIFGLPFIVEPPPPVEESIPVDLVPLGQITAAPPPKPAELKPPEPPKAEQPKPEPPKEETKVEPPKAPPPPSPPPPPPPSPPPPPPPPTPPPPAPPPPPKTEAPAPVPKPEPPKEAPKPEQQAEVKPPPKKPPPPQDDFQSLLKTIDKMKTQPQEEKPAKPQKPQPPPQDDFKALEKTLAQMQPAAPAPAQTPGTSNIRASEISLQPTASDIDFVRAQIERHWNFDAGARDAANLIVQVRVALLPDGTVASATVVSDSRYDTDGFYRSAADSARRAVLAASPLQLPPGKYDQFKDFTFRFDPRNAVR